MPVISTQKFVVPIETGEKEERKMKINFNQKFGGFYIFIENLWIFYISDDERNELGISYEKRWGTDSFIMIETDFDKLINKFEHFLIQAIEKIQSVKREKVLIITFDVNSITETHMKEGSYQRESFSNKSRFSWDKYDKTEMEFNYKVGYKCGGLLFEEDMKKLSSYSYERAYIIAWTKERQEFFSKMQNGFHELIWMIDEFLKNIIKEPKKLDNYIKSGMKLLPEKRRDEKHRRIR